MIVYDLETFNTDRALPYANCIYRLSKTAGIYYRDISDRNLEKCKKDCIVLKKTDICSDMLDHVSQFNGEAIKVNN